jgi:hypothetical protein
MATAATWYEKNDRRATLGTQRLEALGLLGRYIENPARPAAVLGVARRGHQFAGLNPALKDKVVAAVREFLRTLA